jgi:hypothetical protein
MDFIRFLPSFCFSRSLCLRETSPLSLPRERGRVHYLKPGDTLEFMHIESGNFVAKRNSRSRNQQIIWPDHLSARLKVGPNAGMNARLHKVKGLNGNYGQDLFHMAVPPCFAGGILSAFYSVKELGRGNGSDHGLRTQELPEKTAHVELASLVRYQ